MVIVSALRRLTMLIPRKVIAFPITAIAFTLVLQSILIGALTVNESRKPGVTKTRRNFIASSLLTPASGCVSISTASALLSPKPAHAARGAAELDLEYYARDIFGGNKKEGNVQASKPPPMPPPRTIKEPLLSWLLSEDTSCVPKQVLLSMISSNSKSFRDSVQERVSTYRSKASRAFFAHASWQSETLADQYYFDLSAYALWRTAADFLSNSIDRDIYVRRVGRQLLENMKGAKLVSSAASASSQGPPRTKISSITSEVLNILNTFEANGFLKSYRLGSNGEGEVIFDEVDDEALAQGSSVDCLLSLIEPATLGSALQITGEQSRFAPDYIGPTVAALWESSLDVKCQWETYFVDNEYRPNPKDYFPNEQLIQFTISRI